MGINLGWTVGQVMGGVEYEEGSGAWWFAFQGYGGLRVACPWQILVAGRLIRASGDHGQQYGLPAHIDAAAEATGLLTDHVVQTVDTDPASGDLTVNLDNATVLRTFADSAGYEVWHLVGPNGEEIVGQGGRAIPLRGPSSS